MAVTTLAGQNIAGRGNVQSHLSGKADDLDGSETSERTRKPRHEPSSSNSSTSNSSRPAASRPPGTGAARSSAESRAAWAAGAAARVRGRGTGQTSPFGAAAAAGRGSARGMHDSGPYKPDHVGEIPEDQLQMSFSRSSGAGGQNVNKLSTKVELRFVVQEAGWLPHDVRLRLARHQSGRVNGRGELIITSQEFRTQKQNRSAVLQRLRAMINEAWEPAKERKMRTGISKAGKEIRKADKRHRSQVKAGRSKLSSRDFDD